MFSLQSIKAQETIFEQEWVKTYSSQDSIYNQATAIDVNGNVYVTGFTYSNETQADITTIKYSETGELLWVQTYNGTGNKHDRATGINFDSNGNIYVCGFTTNLNNNTDFILIKYNENGDQQWLETYDYNENDIANSILIDSDDNIYLSGVSYDTDNDFLTIKYDQNGNQIWSNRKNFGINDHAESIKLFNNILYVSGTAEMTSYDFAIIAYSLDGTELWSSTVNSENNNSDFAKDLTINNNGVFVTGYSQNANIYQFFTVNLSLSGVFNWSKQYVSNGNWNVANSICSDNLGNIYAAGITNEISTVQNSCQAETAGLPICNSTEIASVQQYNAGLNDLFIVNFEDNSLKWSTFYGGVTDEYNDYPDVALGIDKFISSAVDDNGSYYVSGLTTKHINGTEFPSFYNSNYYFDDYNDGPGSATDIFILGYNKDFQLKWATLFGEGNDANPTIDASNDVLGGLCTYKDEYMLLTSWTSTSNYPDAQPNSDAYYHPTLNAYLGLPVTGISRFGTIDADEVGTVEEFDNNEIGLSVYPNPANNTITIEADIEIEAFTIFNSIGQIIQTTDYTKNVNISSFPTGFYLVQVKTKEGVFNTRFIKE